MSRLHVGVALPLALALSVVLTAQPPAPRARSFAARTVFAVKHDVSPALRDIPPDLREAPDEGRATHAPFIVPKGRRGTFGPQADGALQSGPVSALLALPTVNFDGVNNRNGVLPPDTNGDVGPNHYVQWVNLSFAVFSKTGTTAVAPTNGNTVFSGFGGPCETSNDGDPIVLYDEMADRWLLSQFALPNYPSGPFYQCIAISTGSNPGGSYYRYQFQISATKLNDYPKFGVWPDGYYLTVNQFSGNTYAGAGIAAFERVVMLTGGAARMSYVDTNDQNLGGMLPADFDGDPLTAAPPAGTPNYVIQFDDNTPTDQLEIWKFTPNWGATGTFTHVTDLPVAAFDSNMCGYARNCIPQPGTNAKLDAISDRLMYRLQYRHIGTQGALVTNHTVDANGADRAGIRWYELRVNDGTENFGIRNQGTFSPDATHRWMASAAMDKDGNIALAYNTSSSTQYPSIRYTGRLVNDAANTMTLGEADILVGSGSQTHSSSRWGDYSNLSVDPSDGCTFWATLEYTNQGKPITAPWRTRIAAFALSPACGGGGGGGDTVPSTPASLSASASGKRGIALAWTDSSNNETGFKIFRCTGANCTPDSSNVNNAIATTGANTTSYKNGGLTSGTTYGYVVTACNAAGCSGPSPVARATAR